MLLISAASAESNVTTGPYNITFDLKTPLNYTVEIMPPFVGGDYTSYSVLINVSNETKAGVYIFDLKNPEEVNITAIATEYKAYVHDMNNSSVEVSRIDGKDGVIARYVSPQNKQIVQGIYWPDSNIVGNASEGSTEVRIYAAMPQNSAEDIAIAESLINTLHVEMPKARSAEASITAAVNQTPKKNLIIQSAEQAIKPDPYLRVSDQNVENNHGYAIIDEAFSNGPGWIVVYNEKYAYSRPYMQPLGYTHIEDGLSRIVKVKLNMALVTPRLYAVLFRDEGQVGSFEYPGQDFPLDPRAVEIYSFSSKWPSPMDDFNIDWRNHASIPGRNWL